MKWAKIKKPDQSSEKDKAVQQVDKNDSLCFDEFPDEASLQQKMVQPENKWTEYFFKPVPDFDPPVAESYKKFQERYEIFCGGYLMFHNDVVRNKSIDHTIHFTWADKNDKGYYSVAMYLSPAPVASVSRSVKKAGEPLTGEFVDNPNGSMTLVQGMATDDGSVDPPPPPPPPPPKMH